MFAQIEKSCTTLLSPRTLGFTTRFYRVEKSYIESNWKFLKKREMIDCMKQLTLTEPATVMHLIERATGPLSAKVKLIPSLFSYTLLTMRLSYCDTDLWTKYHRMLPETENKLGWKFMSGSTTTCQQVIEKSKYIILVVCSCGTKSYWVLCYSDSDSFSKKEPLYFFNDAFSLTLSSEPLYMKEGIK